METPTYTAIGLMSGTSLDGLDLAAVRFIKADTQWHFELLHTESIPYDDEWQEILREAITFPQYEVDKLHNKYGKWLGRQTRSFIDKHNLHPDLIASHGHTVFHQPEKGLTVQVGSGQEIADATGYKVVCNFRQLDVSLGGQGAPLAPIGDELLFGNYVACLNLGGIANISFRVNKQRVAFDIGMANMLLNYLANQVDRPYDKAGELARSGRVNNELLAQLNDLAYYHLPYPKSTGYEWFLAAVKPIVDAADISVVDKLATAVEHEVSQIGQVMTQYVTAAGQVLVTGGGALNDYFIERMEHYTPSGLEIIVPDKKLIEFKEALVFALMGVLRIHHEINCLRSVTGASKDSCAGDVFVPGGKRESK